MKKHLNSAIWQDFSGAPMLLLPREKKYEWFGFYNTQPDAGTSDSTPDAYYKNKPYFISTDFDFEHPKTDYDFLCKRFEDESKSIVESPVGGAIAISGFYDAFTWLDEELLLINGRMPYIDLKQLTNLQWQNAYYFVNQFENLIFINSCCSFIMPENDLEQNSDYTIHKIPKGNYHIRQASYNVEYCAELFWFCRIH